METDPRKKEFLQMVEAVGSPVVRQLLLEVIDNVKNKTKRNELKQKLDEILPARPLATRNIVFGSKRYFLVFKPCVSIEDYSIEAELEKVKSVIPEEKHEYFMNEVSITLSVIPNIYQRLMDTNTEFATKLESNLPDDKKDIFTNLIEHKTSTVCMYESGLHFAMYVEDAA